jgi:hypothetical protein
VPGVPRRIAAAFRKSGHPGEAFFPRELVAGSGILVRRRGGEAVIARPRAPGTEVWSDP